MSRKAKTEIPSIPSALGGSDEVPNHNTHGRGPVILVTGASSGIGRAVARRFGSLHARVGLLARRHDRLEEVAHELEGLGAEALILVADVSRRAQVETAVQAVIQRWGRIDVLINNAAYRVSGRVEDCLAEDFEQQIATNFLGVVYPTKAVLPLMRKQGSGSIVNVSSFSGRVYGATDSAYCASKAAVTAFTLSLRQELRGSGISISLISPGRTATEIFERTVYRGVGKEELDGPEMSPDEVARQIISCVAKPRREVISPLSAKLYTLVYCTFPALTESRDAPLIKSIFLPLAVIFKGVQRLDSLFKRFTR